MFSPLKEWLFILSGLMYCHLKKLDTIKIPLIIVLHAINIWCHFNIQIYLDASSQKVLGKKHYCHRNILNVLVKLFILSWKKFIFDRK